jgi:hypothetical protein
MSNWTPQDLAAYTQRRLRQEEPARRKMQAALLNDVSPVSLLEKARKIVAEKTAKAHGARYSLPIVLAWFKECLSRCLNTSLILLEKAATIEALWCKENGYSWTYKTAIPHAAFDIMEDKLKYCRGIVIALKDLPRA